MIDRNPANSAAIDRHIGADVRDGMPWESDSKRRNGEV